MLAAGELVYADQQHILCRDFNYRDADTTKVTPMTTDLLVFVDGHEGVGQNDLQKATEQVAQFITRFNGGIYEAPLVFPFKRGSDC